MKPVLGPAASILAALCLMTGCGAEPESLAPAQQTLSCPQGSILTYENFGQPFFSEYCAGCHATMFSALAPIRSQSGQILNQTVLSTRMPPAFARQQPSSSERALLGEWLVCGAPD